MLREAVELQQNAVSRLVELIEERNELTFRAPTGSGKTYMMADFMNRILENTEDVVFLVSTLSKGNLARQNFDKFQEYKIYSNIDEEKQYDFTKKNIFISFYMCYGFHS